MAEDLKTGTTDATTGTTAQAADGSAGAPAVGSAGAETTEELRRRLIEEQTKREEAERKNAQLLAEKTNTERARREAEAMRAGAGTVSTPPTGAPPDPFAERIAAQQRLAMYYPEDTFEGQQARSTLLSLQANQAIWYDNQMSKQQQRELLRLPDAKRAAVMDKLETGQYASVKAALEAVEGKDKDNEVQSLRAKLDELEKRLANGAAAPTVDVSTASRGIDAPTHRKLMGLSEYNRILEAGGPKAKSLLAEFDSGNVELDFNR